MPQLGSNEKPVLMSSKKNKGRLYKPSDGGKGSAPRVNICLLYTSDAADE